MTASSRAHYHLHPGKLHHGGSLTIATHAFEGELSVELEFVIDKKGLVPIPPKYLQGSYHFKLPASFQNEEGYLELEKKHSMELMGVRVTHLGRRDSYEWIQGHWVQIELLNGKGSAEILYHPLIASIGWSEIKITVNAPFLEHYTLSADLKRS